MTDIAAVATSALFQSAPLTEARGDTTSIGGCSRTSDTYAVPRYVLFQSAPLTEARGDIELLLGPSRVAEWFQSAPLTLKPFMLQIFCLLQTFLIVLSSYKRWFLTPTGTPLTGGKDETLNPLPSPKQGEIWILTPFPVMFCFNPLPSPKQGEISNCCSGLLSCLVSIRSPHLGPSCFNLLFASNLFDRIII